MRPEFLLPETTVRDAGIGPVIDLREERGGTLFLTLGITRILENQSVEVGIWGSPDGLDWGRTPLAAFPQKYYCGVYQLELDLSSQPRIRYVRAQWQMKRWGKSTDKPLFTMYLLAHTPDRHLIAAVA